MDACEKLVKRYTPDGAKVRFRNDGEWRPSHAQPMDDGTFDILSPYPDTPFKALVFLHECAHIVTGDWHKVEYVVHESEFRAEMTAMAWWRAEGGEVPRKYIETAKRYVRACIKDDRKKGVPIKPHIEKWAGKQKRRRKSRRR